MRRCFDGGQVENFSNQTEKKIIGLDLDFEGLVTGKNNYQNIIFINGSGNFLPLINDLFDVVIFSETLEHIPPHHEKSVISEIHRVSKPERLIDFEQFLMLDYSNTLIQ